MKNIIRSLLLFSAGLAVNSHADSGAFIFGALGQTSFKVIGQSASDTSYALGGGYSFNKNFALEARYDDFGAFSEDGYSFSSNAYGISLRASLPVSDAVSLYGKVGLSFWEINDFKPYQSYSSTASESDNELHYGLGGEFAVSQTLKLGAEYNMLNLSGFDDLDINTLAIFARWNF